MNATSSDTVDTPRRALIVVDVQNDFVDGSLATERGAEVAAAIDAHIREVAAGAPEQRYAAIVGTKDWHIDPEGHFAAPGTEPDYVDTWPVHCVAETPGAEICPKLDEQLVEAWFLKGAYTAAYSGFEGELAGAREGEPADLAGWLRSRNITDVTVVGIATDYCVRATARDAQAAGFSVTVLSELCSPVSDEGERRALQELRGVGIAVR